MRSCLALIVAIIVLGAVAGTVFFLWKSSSDLKLSERSPDEEIRKTSSTLTPARTTPAARTQPQGQPPASVRPPSSPSAQLPAQAPAGGTQAAR